MTLPWERHVVCIAELWQCGNRTAYQTPYLSVAIRKKWLEKCNHTMGIGSFISQTKRIIRRIVHLLARPVRRDHGQGGALIQTYRGYGSSSELYLMGRVYRQPAGPSRERLTSAKRDMLDVVRRVLRRGVCGAVLNAQVKQSVGTEDTLHPLAEPVTVHTDADGYFCIRIGLKQSLPHDQRWHHIHIELVQPVHLAHGDGARAEGHVFVPPITAQRIVISDIDDTVMYTGVVNKLKMIWRLFMQGPRSRVAFPGVASLYRGLHAGPTHDQCNPMLYVSRAPWGIYEILDEFFRLHRIPNGPILFLREWGISWLRPLPRRAEHHKLLLIRDMLDIYKDYPCVLIGDSGQHDPEIYSQIVQEYPSRVEAVYIRNVSRSPKRVQAIESLAKKVLESGSMLMLSSDSAAVARHAEQHGLISRDALQKVLADQSSGLEPASQMPTLQVRKSTDERTKRAVESGDLEKALQQHAASEAPPNVIVESDEHITPAATSPTKPH
jgi:phosphatidate phosphatase APP1